MLDQIAADEVVLSAAAEGRLPATVVRLAQLYGPRDPRCPEWFFIKRVLDGRAQVAVPDRGLAIRHRGFVQNMAWGVVQALTVKRAIGEVYNLGDEKVYTLLQLVRGDCPLPGAEVGDLFRAGPALAHAPRRRLLPRPSQGPHAPALPGSHGAPRRAGIDRCAALHQKPYSGDWRWPGLEAPFDYAREDAVIAAYGERLEPERLDEAQRHKEI